MAIKLDGTKGLTTPGLNTNSTYTDTYTDGLVLDYSSPLGRISVGSSDGLAFYNGGVATTELMRLDASGNLGIGTSSPAAKLNAYGATSYAGLNVQAVLSDSTAMAAGTGGVLAFEGKYSGSSLANYAAIGGLKENSTSGNYSGYMAFYTRSDGSLPAERMRLDSSGNLGLGVTPSGWASGVKAIDVNAYASFFGDNDTTFISNNAYLNASSAWIYKATNAASYYRQQAGAHKWYYAASGTAGNAISFTQAMTLDASGNLGIGTSSPSYKLDIQGNTSGQFWASIKNTNSGASAIGGWFFGNDSYGDVGGVFVGSTGGSGFGGANSMNIGSWRSAPLAMFTNNTERMRIDSSGNVGIGTSSPSAKLHVNGDLFVASNSNLQWSTYSAGTSGVLWTGNGTNNTLDAYTTGTLRARIDSSGNLLVGTTAQPSSTVKGIAINNDPSTTASVWSCGSKTAANTFIQFVNGNGQVGYILTNGSTTTYSTSSDQRLKTNVEPAGSAIQSILDFPVDQFDWIADGSHQDFGAVAQKAINVIPEMVSVPTNEDDMWGIDWSKAVPRLIKTIQEQQAIIESLQARITTLEGK